MYTLGKTGLRQFFSFFQHRNCILTEYNQHYFINKEDIQNATGRFFSTLTSSVSQFYRVRITINLDTIVKKKRALSNNPFYRLHYIVHSSAH